MVHISDLSAIFAALEDFMDAGGCFSRVFGESTAVVKLK